MNRQFLSLLVISASISTAACGSGETYTVESQPEITQSGLHKSAFDSMVDSTQIMLTVWRYVSPIMAHTS